VTRRARQAGLESAAMGDKPDVVVLPPALYGIGLVAVCILV
jgi:hypothetical protein